MGTLNLPRRRGFTLLEAVVSLGVITIVAAGAASVLSQPLEADREDETIQKLVSLRNAIVGDSRIVTKESRTDFGFVGSMGSLPVSLEDLWIRGAQPIFTFDTTLRMGSGWAGPYFSVLGVDEFFDIALDAWGNTIVYEVATGVSASTGQTYRARLISYGADADVGGGDDLTVEIYETEVFATVAGYVRDASGNPLTGVTAIINHPSSGSPATMTTQTDLTGAYSFSDVPFGNRSLEVKPALVYVAGTAFAKGGSSNDVEFVIQNFSANDIVMTNLNSEYDVTAFYEKIKIGNSTVFNDSSDRAASGETIIFSSSKTIKGTGSDTGIISSVRVQSGFTLALDQNVGQSAQAGATKRVKLENFKDVESGGGTDVDMTGISIQVTFSDGSIVIFSPERK